MHTKIVQPHLCQTDTNQSDIITLYYSPINIPYTASESISWVTFSKDKRLIFFLNFKNVYMLHTAMPLVEILIRCKAVAY